MKARFENDEIKIYQSIPKKFEKIIDGRPQTVFGYDKKPESVHYGDGFRDVIKPPYDKDLKKLGEVFHNEEDDNFTFTIIDKELPPIEDVRTLLFKDLGSRMDVFSLKISRAKLLYPNDEELDQAIEIIKGVKVQTVTDIKTLELAALIKYRIRQQDIDYLNGLLEPFQL